MVPAQRFMRKRVHRANRRRSRQRVFLWFLLPLLPLFVLTPIAVAAAVYTTMSEELQDPRTALAYTDLGGAKIYDRNGVLLYQFADDEGGFQDAVPLDRMSDHIINATVATEDQSFWENPGVNTRGLLRAAYENLLPGDAGFLGGSGGSSITQQLVKNTLIPPEDRAERSVIRKVKETVLALELTRTAPKEEILEAYLNRVFYGYNAYGVQAAARQYFGKNAADLTLAESAFLAGLPQSPSDYDPYKNLEAAKARQRQVLDLMVEARFVTPAEADAAWQEELALRPPTVDIKAPHFVFHVRDVLRATFGESMLRRGGLTVTTTLDYRLQQRAEAIVNQRVTEFETQRNCGCHNGALVTIDNRTGGILAFVGSRDYHREDIDGEVSIPLRTRNPGSAFKPVVYLTAFLKLNWVPATRVHDIPTTFVFEDNVASTFRPVNFTGRSYGTLPVRMALANSLNVPANRTAAIVGTRDIVDMAHRMGITTLDEGYYGPSIATGGAHVTLLDLTYVYSVFANNGRMVGMPAFQDYGEGLRNLDPAPILSVKNARGDVLFEHREPESEQVVPASAAYLITDILKDSGARAMLFGQRTYFDLDRPAAAKSGTQQGERVSEAQEVWTFGYTPDLTTGVWIGNTDNTPIRNVESSNSAALIWHDFMIEAHQMLKLPPRDFQVPEGVEFRPVCDRPDVAIEGKEPVCEEPFRDGTIRLDVNGRVTNRPDDNSRPATRNIPTPEPSDDAAGDGDAEGAGEEPIRRETPEATREPPAPLPTAPPLPTWPAAPSPTQTPAATAQPPTPTSAPPSPRSSPAPGPPSPTQPPAEPTQAPRSEPSPTQPPPTTQPSPQPTRAPQDSQGTAGPAPQRTQPAAETPSGTPDTAASSGPGPGGRGR